MKLLALALVLAGSTSARAETEELCPEGQLKAAYHIEYTGGKPLTVIDTKIIVCERVPRPAVLYVLSSMNVKYAWEDVKPLDVMSLVLSTVKKAPF